jgi:hypothetical protein
MGITRDAAAQVTALDHPAHDEGCLFPTPTRSRAAAMLALSAPSLFRNRNFHDAGT